MNRSSFPAAPTGAIPHLRELREANIEKNSSTLFTTETRSTRRCTEKPDASVKSPCPPCLSGETGHVAAAGSLSELQLDKTRPSADTPIDRRWERDRLLLICCRERWTCSFCE